MKTRALLLVFALVTAAHAEPLRVFIRGGEKNRGQEIHAHPRFLAEWKTLLAERGMVVDGTTAWPTAEQAAKADVIVAYAQDGGDATPAEEKVLEDFAKRGGGLVVIHTAAVSFTNPAWWRDMIGGAWVPKQTKWKEGPMDLYYTENQYLGGGHPITKGASNFHLDDEIYYDMDMKPEARVLAAAYTPKVKEGKKPAEGNPAHIYDIQPQMWVYERGVAAASSPQVVPAASSPRGGSGGGDAAATARAFVSIPGHKFATFGLPHYRAILLRGIAWAGKRANLDEYVRPEELSALTYPEGGPQKPEVTLKNLEVHPDFTMSLVAAEPLITKPMNFDWDPAGRLWVAETPEYPNGRRGMRPDYRGKEWKDHGGLDPTPGVQERPGRDKISILTDTNGDGVMDRKDVFYEGLDLVTGFVFHRDGVIATQAPDILFLRDTDGDGKAEKVEKLYTGLGTRDTHAVINNPRWGWDGWIYATHGYSLSSEVKNVRGETQGTIGSGVVRFRPDGSKIEQYSSKSGNTWGLTITADNRVMWTQPTSGQLLMHTVLPEYALARGRIGNTPSYKVVEPSGKIFPAMNWEQLAYVQIDWVGSFTAAAGCVIYDGGTWPAEYHGDYFTTEPTVNVIHHARLTPDGSSYTAAKLPGREETEFVRSRDMWWRPIEVRVGPDGAMYVADFYNQAVIHNDTRGPDHNGVNAAVRPDRDHYFGRIWRIDHKGRAGVPPAVAGVPPGTSNVGKAPASRVPDLSKASVEELAKALGHPNGHVRMTASRLLVEKHSALPTLDADFSRELITQAVLSKVPEQTIACMWTAHRLGVKYAWDSITFQSPIVARNAANVFEEEKSATFQRCLMTARSKESMVASLRAFAAADSPDDVGKFVVAFWPELDDDFQRSAAVGAASRNPVAAISAALDLASEKGRMGVPPVAPGILPGAANVDGASSSSPARPSASERNSTSDVAGKMPATTGGTPVLPAGTSLEPLVTALTQNLTSAEDAAKIVIAAAAKSGADELKRTILETLGKSDLTAPEMTPELTDALGRLLGDGAASPRPSGEGGPPSLLAAALPLAARWDKSGALKDRIAKHTDGLLTSLPLLGDDNNRLATAQSLIGLHGTDPRILPALVKLLGADSGTKPTFQRRLILALGAVDDRAVGQALAGTYAQLPPEARTVAFDTLLKRADWTHALLDVVKQASGLSTGGTPVSLSPADAFRLRTHPNKKVAERAAKLLDELNPTAKLKKDAIAKLAPIVEGKGDPEKGKQLFTVTCATCHEFAGAGAKIGPALTGMGSHGAGELLSAIVDPNAEVDPSFLAWNLETKDGQLFNGVIESENPTTITLKSLVGVQQVRVADLKSRVNTGRSLMPEGFEGLGGEALRDMIAYMQSVDGGRFRTLDLRDAFTASTSTGLYHSADAKRDSFEFAKTGTVQVGGIPFSIVGPEKAPRNILVLKGGPPSAYSKTLPQRVEVKAGGFKANRLHFLGGVTGWGFNGRNNEHDEVLKVTIHTTQGQREGMTFRNGVEFADYNGRVDVPGSKFAEGVVKGGHQLRWFSRPLALGAVEIDRITIESLDTGAAPTLVAITAELADANAAQSTTGGPPVIAQISAGPAEVPFVPQFTDPVPQPPASAKGPRVLLVGGGSSHDFVKFFGKSDKATLAPHVGWVAFTRNLNGIPAILDRIDVLVLSANQPIAATTAKALIDFANSGKGIVAYHPGTWYAWKNFPEWNAQIVGGGARSHDKLGEYEVTISTDHPITRGIPKTFRLTDELYHFIPDAAAVPIEVLATATSTQKPGTYPQVFVVKHPKSRIVGLTLGHDARAHDLPAFQTFLRNAVAWAAGK